VAHDLLQEADVGLHAPDLELVQRPLHLLDRVDEGVRLHDQLQRKQPSSLGSPGLRGSTSWEQGQSGACPKTCYVSHDSQIVYICFLPTTHGHVRTECGLHSVPRKFPFIHRDLSVASLCTRLQIIRTKNRRTLVANTQRAREASTAAAQAWCARLDEQGVIEAGHLVAGHHGAVQPDAGPAGRPVRLDAPCVWLQQHTKQASSRNVLQARKAMCHGRGQPPVPDM